jgi:hypothetical protein
MKKKKVVKGEEMENDEHKGNEIGDDEITSIIGSPEEHALEKASTEKCRDKNSDTSFQHDLTMVESCRNCGIKISKAEKFNVYNGAIVCSECYEKLNKGINLPISEKMAAGLKFVKTSKESNWINEWSVGSTIGIVISVILVFMAFLPSINQILSGRHELRDPINRLANNASFIAFMGTALCLTIRCFRRGFNLWRGLLIIVGGCIMFVGLTPVAYFLYIGGKFPSISGLMGSLLPPLFGAILLIWGFKAKKE